MASKSSIPYLVGGQSWSPATGCDPNSGSDCWTRCWARGIAHRFKRDFTPTFHPDRLAEPLHLRSSQRIGVSFNGDLFASGIADEQIDAVMGIVLACRFFENKPNHLFMLLTKRIKRAADYFKAPPVELLQRWCRAVEHKVTVGDGDEYFEEAVSAACAALWNKDSVATTTVEWWSHPENLFPLSNLMVGTSVANQPEADERVPWLLRIPGRLWLSVEPMVGPVDLTREYLASKMESGQYPFPQLEDEYRTKFVHLLEYVVCAGETGCDSRPLNLDWVRQLRNDCINAKTSFAFKNQTQFLTLDFVQHAALPEMRA